MTEPAFVLQLHPDQFDRLVSAASRVWSAARCDGEYFTMPAGAMLELGKALGR